MRLSNRIMLFDSTLLFAVAFLFISDKNSPVCTNALTNTLASTDACRGNKSRCNVGKQTQRATKRCFKCTWTHSLIFQLYESPKASLKFVRRPFISDMSECLLLTAYLLADSPTMTEHNRVSHTRRDEEDSV